MADKNILEKLEKELNSAHKEYLAVSCKFPASSKEYKDAKEKYFNLSEEYSKAFTKSTK